MDTMTAHQLTHIYHIATRQGCGQQQIQFLIESGYLADLFAGQWPRVNRDDLRRLGRLPSEGFLVKSNLRTLMTVKLGVYRYTDALRAALKQSGNTISIKAESILDHVPVSPTEVEVELVDVSVAEFGYQDGAYRWDIYKRALELGLALCPAEVGPQLRLQYKEQPCGQLLFVAMEPITISPDNRYLFSVAHHNGERRLISASADPDMFWFPIRRFVFVRRN